MIVRNFEYLLALHREGHFGNAAKSCNVSQPTLSAGIKQLEEDMGVEIVRHGRRYDGLTSEGMRVLSWAQQMYDDCKGLERELSALRRGIEGQFRLGILPGTAGVAPTLSIALAEKTPLLNNQFWFPALLPCYRRFEKTIWISHSCIWRISQGKTSILTFCTVNAFSFFTPREHSNPEAQRGTMFSIDNSAC